MGLLTKSRKINAMLQKKGANSVNFIELAETLSEILNSNTFIFDHFGKLQGFSSMNLEQNKNIIQFLVNFNFSKVYLHSLFNLKETTPNLDINSKYSIFLFKNKDFFKNTLTSIVPIHSGGVRLGTLILTRFEKAFNNDDLILAEYGATVVGIEILNRMSIEIKEETQKKATVKMAINSLSYSEREAIKHIFRELKEKEGLLVASKIADRIGITRSVVVNAFRKLESAGVIETLSLGMKGTHIKVLNDMFLPKLLKLN